MRKKQKLQRLGQSGFTHVIAFIFILVILLGVGYIVFSRDKHKTGTDVLWSFDEKKKEWFVKEGAAPACKDPLVFDYDPLDLSKVESVGMPGVYVSKSYKVHGGMRLPVDSEGRVDIRLPMDATITGLKRYYDGQTEDMQHLISFENDCGIQIYFDHLNVLSPELQKLAENTPEPTINDTRSSPDDAPPRVKLKAGDIIATRVGFPSASNYGFDFGVVDYRQRNQISKNEKWADLHKEFMATEWYGVCWLDKLPGAEKAKTLIKLQTDTRRTQKFVSDYCEEGDYTTLDFNNGQPADAY